MNEQVRRNQERFPSDFMFQVTLEEHAALRSQNATLKRGQHSKYLPYAFTNNGVAMLSSVLNSPQAILVNIQIMRIFTRLRELMASHAELRKKIEELENRYDYPFKIVFDAIKNLLEPPAKPKRTIGFIPNN